MALCYEWGPNINRVKYEMLVCYECLWLVPEEGSPCSMHACLVVCSHIFLWSVAIDESPPPGVDHICFQNQTAPSLRMY